MRRIAHFHTISQTSRSCVRTAHRHIDKKNIDEKAISDPHEQRHSHDTTLEPRPRARLRPQHQLEDHR